MKYFQFATLVMLLALYPLGSANAQAVLDQSDTVSGVDASSDFTLGQTFTVGITGALSSVELEFGTNGAPIDVMIATTSGGLPTSTILGSQTVNPGVVFNDWFTFNFSPGISVHAGEVLAIEVPSADFGWDGDLAGTYSGGLAYFDETPNWKPLHATFGSSFPTDFSFQTFVIPAPEPSSLVLLAVGAAGMFLAARRRGA